jgi:capsule polysaccharide modification protein KpsS
MELEIKMELDFVIPVMTREPAVSWLPFYCKLGDELKRRGYSVGFITVTRFGDRGLAASGHLFFNLFDMIRELRDQGAISCSEAEAARLEETYHLGGMRNFYHCEKVYHYKKDAQLRREMIECLRVAEEFTRRHRVKCFLLFNGGELIRRSLYVVARSQNIPTIWASRSPMPGRMALSSTELDLFDTLEVKPYEILEPEAIRQAEQYIKDFRSRKQMSIRKAYRLRLWVSPFSAINLLKGVYRRYTVNEGREPLPLFAQDYLLLRRKLKKLFYPLLMRRPQEGEKFVFFPLHLVREAQLAVRAPHCYQQEYIVELVSRFLPAGYKLYVKEHPNHLGELPWGALRRIARLDNVCLLDSEVNSHHLIEKCAAVVTINSTAGYEAILYQKPVVVLGKPFYSGLGLTLDARDFFDLPQAIQQALQMKELDYKKVVAFVHAVLEQSYPGIPGDAADQNVALFCDSVLAFAVKRGRIRT